MKKILSFIFVSLLTVTTSASHLLGGIVGVSQTSQDSTTIGVALITDPQGLPSPNSITVEKWEMNSVGWYTYRTAQLHFNTGCIHLFHFRDIIS